MLVLKRKQGEAIHIGDDVTLTVLAIEGDQVKLGIEAPRHIDIHRHEVYIQMQEENESARDSANLMKQMIQNQSEA